MGQVPEIGQCKQRMAHHNVVHIMVEYIIISILITNLQDAMSESTQVMSSCFLETLLKQ